MEKNFDTLTFDDKAMIIAAINILLKDNPKLPEQLAHLAHIKQTKPFVWTMALKKLGAE